MIKFEFDLDEKEIADGIRANFDKAVAQTMSMVQSRARQLASQKLRSGMRHWEKGFSVDKVSDGTWMISMTGKLANMMEDGFKTGEIKDMILSGNRAKYNRSQGKNYVDVPLPLNADQVTGQIGKTTVTVQQFKDADAVMQAIKVSDWARGGVKKEKRIVQRVEDVIRSRKPKDADSSAQFMIIRRVSEKSKGWPTSPFAGAKVLEALDIYLEQAFEESLNSLI
jgi:hypothetical protein